MFSIQHYSYHNHTNFSDGDNTIEEMVQHAKQIGFTELGISDHLIVHKNMGQSISVPYWQQQPHGAMFYTDFAKILPMYQKHCKNIRRISQKEKFKIFIGFEVDFFTYSGWFEEFKHFLTQLDYDYVISGNHMLFDENCENVFDLHSLKAAFPDKNMQQEYLHRHFTTIKKSVKSGVFKFLAHMDYARKLGDDICGPQSFWFEKMSILDELQKNNIAIEISTKGLRKIGDFYPCKEILNEIAARDITVVISDDAHKKAELGLNFDVAENELLKHSINKRLKL